MTLDLRTWPARARAVWSVFAVAASLAAAFPSPAQAGGLYLFPLGVEPAARAGARVAGVSSPHALWYNPAGLAHAKRTLLLDLNLPMARASFTRFRDDGVVEPTARAESTFLPLPTLAYADNFGLSRFGFGIGLILPPGYALDWPSQVDNQPAPQRYSILNTDNTAMGSLALAAAYRPLDRLSLGVAVYLTAAQVGGEVAISACDYAFCSQPEAPEWEGRTRFLLGPVYTATATFGARYDFDGVRLGGSLQIRTKVDGDASFDIQLPDQAIFDGVTVQNADGGDDLRADMAIELPMIARLGVEADLLPTTQVELAGTWENWASQGDIVVRPRGVIARDVPGVGDVQADPVSLARSMRDTWAAHLGGTQDLSGFMPRRRKLAVHAGFMFESSSFAPRDLSPTTLDSNKVLLSVGATVELVPGLMLDVAYGHMFMHNQEIRNSRVLLPAAIRPVPVDANPDQYEVGDQPTIGNGRYTIEADFVALGMRWLIDDTRAAMRDR